MLDSMKKQEPGPSCPWLSPGGEGISLPSICRASMTSSMQWASSVPGRVQEQQDLAIDSWAGAWRWADVTGLPMWP